MHDILSGKSRIALAITEPEAGSDVRGLQTKAYLSADGLHFVVNGQKKVFHLSLFLSYGHEVAHMETVDYGGHVC